MPHMQLPLPRLEFAKFGALDIATDDALARTSGVRVAFTGRCGGTSKGVYASLNMGLHVGDDRLAVGANRRRVLDALGASDCEPICPRQVHGDRLVCVEATAEAASKAASEAASEAALDEASEATADDKGAVYGRALSADSLATARRAAAEGADGIVVRVPRVAALLCFADCVPVVIVSPSGSFAVVHAGWRGVAAQVVPKAVDALSMREGDLAVCVQASYNVYIGPYIHAECFEVADEVRDVFVQTFGKGCLADLHHVDLGACVKTSLERIGVRPDRIADLGICTACRPNEYFSYRASGGVCGRHAALAFRAR